MRTSQLLNTETCLEVLVLKANIISPGKWLELTLATSRLGHFHLANQLIFLSCLAILAARILIAAAETPQDQEPQHSQQPPYGISIIGAYGSIRMCIISHASEPDHQQRCRTEYVCHSRLNERPKNNTNSHITLVRYIWYTKFSMHVCLFIPVRTSEQQRAELYPAKLIYLFLNEIGHLHLALIYINT